MVMSRFARLASAVLFACRVVGAESDPRIGGGGFLENHQQTNTSYQLNNVKLDFDKSAIIVIDVQNDFVDPSGTMSGGGRESVIKPINELLKMGWHLRAFSADYHPSNHVSFKSNSPPQRPTIENGPYPIAQLEYSELSESNGPEICGAEYAEIYGIAADACDDLDVSRRVSFGQETYPAHCVQGTWGQKIHPKLNFNYSDPRDIVIWKGVAAHIDSYSAVFNNIACDGPIEYDDMGYPRSPTCIPKTKPYPQETALPDLLRIGGIEHVFFVGLCFDYCVKYSAIHTAFLGWDTYIIDDGTMACGTPAHVADTRAQLQDNNVKIINSASLRA